jgi:hypothetical protein
MVLARNQVHAEKLNNYSQIHDVTLHQQKECTQAGPKIQPPALCLCIIHLFPNDVGFTAG